MLYLPKKTIRRAGYDYTQGGAYFCTICVHAKYRRKDVFARIEPGLLQMNRFGELVETCWFDLPNHRGNVELDAFVVMPNHVHLVLLLDAKEQSRLVERTFGPQAKESLSTIVGGFKSAVSKAVGLERNSRTSVWQPRFFDRIVRNEQELTNVRRYIENNPANRANDYCHPDHPKFESVWRGECPDPEDLQILNS